MTENKKTDKKEQKKDEKPTSESPTLADGKVDVTKKYGLSGKSLSQDEVDNIVKKYKK